MGFPSSYPTNTNNTLYSDFELGRGGGLEKGEILPGCRCLCDITQSLPTNSSELFVCLGADY